MCEIFFDEANNEEILASGGVTAKSFRCTWDELTSRHGWISFEECYLESQGEVIYCSSKAAERKRNAKSGKDDD